MFIHDIIRRGAQFHPQRVALRHQTADVTYGELDALSDQLAERLRAHGFAGTHGGLYLPNSIEYVVAYFAIAKSGGVIVPTTTAMPVARLPNELDYADVGFVVTDARHADDLREVVREVSGVKGLVVVRDAGRHVDVELLHGGTPALRPHGWQEPTPQSPAAMFATSGTASEPKRVVLSHDNLLANISSFLHMAWLNHRDRSLIVLPMTAIGTNTTELLAYLTVGMTTRIYHGVFVLGEFCRLVDAERISVMNATPFILNMMLWKSSEVAGKLGSLAKLFFASAPMPPDQFRQLGRDFPTIGFHYGYGLTEASPRCTTLVPAHQPAKIGSSGTPLRNVELRIVDVQGHDLPTGELGEVIVRGPNVMQGYYKRPEATQAALRDGWLFTGDCGSLDEDGFVSIRGRKKNIIITRGICVSPEEVEQEIMGSPGVHEAYVASRQDERVGESIVAYVVAREGFQLSEEHLKSFLRGRLDPVKIPSRIEFVPKLQRNFNQKLVRV